MSDTTPILQNGNNSKKKKKIKGTEDTCEIGDSLLKDKIIEILQNGSSDTRKMKTGFLKSILDLYSRKIITRNFLKVFERKS